MTPPPMARRVAGLKPRAGRLRCGGRHRVSNLVLVICRNPRKSSGQLQSSSSMGNGCCCFFDSEEACNFATLSVSWRSMDGWASSIHSPHPRAHSAHICQFLEHLTAARSSSISQAESPQPYLSWCVGAIWSGDIASGACLLSHTGIAATDTVPGRSSIAVPSY